MLTTAIPFFSDPSTILPNLSTYHQTILAGLVVFILGGFVANLQQLYSAFYNWIFDTFISRIEINNDDDTYSHTVQWLNDKELLPKSRNLSAAMVWPSASYPGFKTGKPTIIFTPGSGFHLMFYKGHPIWLQKSVHINQNGPFAQGGMSGARKTISLSTFGKPTILKEMLLEATNYSMNKDGGIPIYSPRHGEIWDKTTSKPRRSIDSVILANEMSKDVVEDIREFLSSKSWYEKRGISYRRGYLFYGPPGGGKSSFLVALASEFDLNICILSLSAKDLGDGQLSRLMAFLPSRSAVVMEDVDSLFDEDRGKKEDTRVTFSGLLNAIDGVGAVEGRLLFLTTNHKDRLDQALIRPGRADKHVYFGWATREQAEKMFSLFYPEATPEQIKDFGAGLPEKTNTSMAKLQGYLMNYKNNCEEALKHMEELAHVEKKSDKKEG